MMKPTKENLNLAILLCTLPQWPKREVAHLALNTPSDHDERFHQARNYTAYTNFINSADRGLQCAYDIAYSGEVPSFSVSEYFGEDQ